MFVIACFICIYYWLVIFRLYGINVSIEDCLLNYMMQINKWKYVPFYFILYEQVNQSSLLNSLR